MTHTPGTSAPDVVVILPTYRRNAPLVWSLSSVLLQRFDDVRIRSAKVVVVNNDKERSAVDEAVARAVDGVGVGPWALETFHRDPQIDPVLSWYGAIGEFTRPGDVAFLQGDDDLVLRDSLAVRTSLLLQANTTMLVTRASGGIVFDAASSERAYLAKDFKLQAATFAPARLLRLPDLERWECAFIGNHAYRISDQFFDIYETILKRMEALPIAGPHQRAMLPLFMGVEACDRATLAGAEVLAAIRGQTRDEIVGARWGVANWSFGVLFATILAVLDGPGWRDRSDLDGLRNMARGYLAYWFLPGTLESRARAELKALGYASMRQFRGAHRRRLLSGLGLILKSITGTRGLRTRLFANLKECKRSQILDQLQSVGPG